MFFRFPTGECESIQEGTLAARYPNSRRFPLLAADSMREYVKSRQKGVCSQDGRQPAPEYAGGGAVARPTRPWSLMS
jgi:hypothetical protein